MAIVRDEIPTGAGGPLPSREAMRVVRSSLGRMVVPRHDLEIEDHANDLRANDLRANDLRANDLRASVRHANVRCGYHRRVDGCARVLQSQRRVGTDPPNRSAMCGHTEADIQGIPYKQNRFHNDKTPLREPESFGADSALCSDTQCGDICERRCDRDGNCDANRDDSHDHDHSDCTNLRGHIRRAVLHRDAVLTREL